jgi:nucleotide-binding universal stress UspA family protein
MIVLKKILVATDFSEPSDAALAYGRELARTFNAQLIVAHVTDDVSAHAYGGPDAIVFAPDLQGEIDEAARRQLDALVFAEDRHDLGALTIVLRSKIVWAAITDYARDTDVDLIVLGTHGRGAVAHLLIGSVAERVVRMAPCPVLTVRRPEHEFVLPDALVAVTKA